MGCVTQRPWRTPLKTSSPCCWPGPARCPQAPEWVGFWGAAAGQGTCRARIFGSFGGNEGKISTHACEVRRVIEVDTSSSNSSSSRSSDGKHRSGRAVVKQSVPFLQSSLSSLQGPSLGKIESRLVWPGLQPRAGAHPFVVSIRAGNAEMSQVLMPQFRPRTSGLLSL